jgi:hypothetical protein
LDAAKLLSNAQDLQFVTFSDGILVLSIRRDAPDAIAFVTFRDKEQLFIVNDHCINQAFVPRFAARL